MRFHRRVRTIYAKELIDIMRDRRTLIAMIVVPIVLYPLLMLGSIQAVSFQAEGIQREEIVIGVISEEQGLALDSLIQSDLIELKQQREQTQHDAQEVDQEPPSPLKVRILAYKDRDSLVELVGQRAIHAGVILDSASLINDAGVQNRIEILYDKEDVRSYNARAKLTELFQRITDRTVDRRKQEKNLPDSFDHPFLVALTDLSAPPSILGQILPLILILMTITGAIYPAIDLTAGERERGTLESLMATPVPIIDLIVGKFLVVTTVAIMGAALNLGSVAATVYFGGFDKVIASSGGGLPIGTMLLILLCLIPFAVLMSAIMIAVCSYARTFKEAQNYVTPVILAVLIPGGIAALPATRLEGVMLVIPVGNMVLLAREFLLGATVPLSHVAIVLLSTSLYAAAAVAIAANIFGQESVVFADAGSLRATFSRRLIKPSPAPTLAMSLLVTSLLFPTWFFVQSAFSPGVGEDATGLLYASGWLMPLLFVILPAFVLWYWKVGLRGSLSLNVPSMRYIVAALLIGVSAWIPAHLVNTTQQEIVGIPKAVLESAEQMAQTLQVLPTSVVFLLIAVIPALCEELLFRGFLLSGLAKSSRKWTAIITSAAIFGVFHFFVFKFVVTAGLGVVLALLCWQSRSILPAMLAHFLHNAIGVANVLYPETFVRIGMVEDGAEGGITTVPLLLGGLMFVAGIGMVAWPLRDRTSSPSAAALADA